MAKPSSKIESIRNYLKERNAEHLLEATIQRSAQAEQLIHNFSKSIKASQNVNIRPQTLQGTPLPPPNRPDNDLPLPPALPPAVNPYDQARRRPLLPVNSNIPDLNRPLPPAPKTDSNIPDLNRPLPPAPLVPATDIINPFDAARLNSAPIKAVKVTPPNLRQQLSILNSLNNKNKGTSPLPSAAGFDIQRAQQLYPANLIPDNLFAGHNVEILSISAAPVPPPNLCPYQCITWSNVTAWQGLTATIATTPSITVSYPETEILWSGGNTTEYVWYWDGLACTNKNPNLTSFSTSWYPQKTFTFVPPITNAALAIYSVGNPLTSERLSANAPFNLVCNSIDNTHISGYGKPITVLNSYELSGNEGYGIIVFPGVHSSITIKPIYPLSGEIYSNFVWGMSACSLSACNTVKNCTAYQVAVDSTAGPTSIDPTIPWPDTGVDVKVGDTLTIVTSGRVFFHFNEPYSCDANGISWWPYGLVDNRFYHEALIGKIGINGTPFLVGTNFSSTVTTAGRLYLVTNDTDRADNVGSFNSTITVNCGNNCNGLIPVIQICNVNSATDDNFRVTLNDIFLGDLDLTQPGVQNGGYFIGSIDHTLTVADGPFNCPGTYLTNYYFDPNAISFNSNNALKMINIQNNDNNNLGSVQVMMMSASDSVLYPYKDFLLNDVYRGGSGLSFAYNFSTGDYCGHQPPYTQCNCENVALQAWVSSQGYNITGAITDDNCTCYSSYGVTTAEFSISGCVVSAYACNNSSDTVEQYTIVCTDTGWDYSPSTPKSELEVNPACETVCTVTNTYVYCRDSLLTDCSNCCANFQALAVGDPPMYLSPGGTVCFSVPITVSSSNFTVNGKTYNVVQDDPAYWTSSAGIACGVPYLITRLS